jgi:hypothetical protein
MESVKKFDPKEYYIKNKERILNYNRKYFKEYYKKNKQNLLKKNIINNNENNIDNRINILIIEKNVTVYF